MTENKFYVTTPIYYVNDLPHLGHTYTTLLADVINRYYSLIGKKTFFLTGTDEHATKISEIAKKQNLNPQKYCDTIVPHWKNAWEQLGIKYNRFIRTTDTDHIRTVEKILDILYQKGDIYKGTYEGLYCIHCEKFLSKEELIENKCPDHKVEPVKYKEENYFFRLSKYKEKIISVIETDQLKILPQTRKNEILGKLSLNLEDISISRKYADWGIQIPFDNTQTTYVWIDALINYLSGVDYFGIYNKDNSYLWPADLHLMAKDILWFHSVIWTGLLLALDIPLPKKLYVHGFFTINGQKMSKTIGNIIRPQQLIETFGTEATRLLVISHIPSGLDGDFTIPDLIEKYNMLLANNYGNLISRTFAMIKKYFNNKLKVKGCSTETLQHIIKIVQTYSQQIENIELNKMAFCAFEISDIANRYIQQKTPWVLAKNNNFEELSSVLSNLLYYIKSATLLLTPFMPQITQKVLSMFNESTNISTEFKKLILENKIDIHTEIVKDAEVLFKKI